ncbi:MAG TPA: S8 family serine peptidase [Solimonas sp.]|nr:S8 family serine peptidase [Solimonas sp.]
MRFVQTTLPVALAVCLSACDSIPGNIPLSESRAAVVAAPAALDECDAAYADAAKSARAPQVGLSVDDFGKPGALFLGFTSDQDRDAAAARLKASPPAALTGVRTYRHLPLIAVASNRLEPALLADLQARLAGLRLVSIDPDRPLQFHLHDANEYVGAIEARETYGVTGRGVGVAVVDSGIDQLQGDFDNVALNIKLLGTSTGLLGSVPFTGGALTLDVTGVSSDTTSGHGTHVAGAVGGTGAMSDGYNTGLAPGATLIGFGTGEAIFVSYAVEAYEFLLDPVILDKYNLRVINNSYGGPAGSGFAPFNVFNLLTKRAHDDGVIAVFSAGNNGDPADDGSASNHSDYGASPCVISVASGIANAGYYDVNPISYIPIFVGAHDPADFPISPGDRRGQLSDFSSRGKKGDLFDHPDITAPGDQVASAYNPHGAVLYAGAGAGPYFNPDHPEWSASYYRLSGTSMSSPQLAGIVALLLEANPDATFAQVLQALTATARPMIDGAGKPYEEWQVGAGFVDVKAALGAIRAMASPLRTVSEIVQYTGSVGPGVNVPEVGQLVEAQGQTAIELPPLPAGAHYSKLKLDISWTLLTDDLDVVVLGPDGNVAGTSGNGAGSFEYVSLRNPAPGTYTVIVNGYTTTPETYTINATTLKRVPGG